MSKSNNGYLTTDICLLLPSDNEYKNKDNSSYDTMLDYYYENYL